MCVCETRESLALDRKLAAGRHCTYPLAAPAVVDSFYVDDVLTGADSTSEARKLQAQLHKLFSGGGFVLRKWKSNDPTALVDVLSHLLDHQPTQEIVCVDNFTKVLGVEWDSVSDTFHPMIPSYSPMGELTCVPSGSSSLIHVSLIFSMFWDGVLRR